MSIVAARERSMTVARVKVSNDYQIEVPLEVREELHIESGDVLIVEVRDGHIFLTPDKLTYVQRFSSFHPEIWEGIDAREYVREIRESSCE